MARLLALLAVLTAVFAAHPALAQSSLSIEQRTQACGDRRPAVCVALLNEYVGLARAEAISDADWLRWKPALDAACGSTLRVGEACQALAFAIGTGAYSEPVDYARALGYYNRACEANLAAACLSSAQYWRQGLGSAERGPDPVIALRQFRKACRLGSKLACDWVSDIVHLKNAEYPQVPYDFAASAEAEYYECVHQANCSWIANAYWDGREGLDPYDPRAARVYLAMCRQGDARFCFGAASAISRDRSYTPAGLVLAYHLDRKACEMGAQYACERRDARIADGVDTAAPFVDPALPENDQYMIAKLALDEGEYPQQQAGIATIRWLAQMENPAAQFEASNWFFFGLKDPLDPATPIVAKDERKAAELLDAAAESGIAEAAFWFAVLRENDAGFGLHVFPSGFARSTARAHNLGSPNILAYEERAEAIRRLEQQAYDAGRAAARREQIEAERRAQSDLLARAFGSAFGASDDQVCANVIQGGRMTRECVSRDYARRNWPGNF